MVEFQVKGMTCGGCAGRVTRAAKSVDVNARIEVDLPAKRVRIESDKHAMQFAQALAQAGYAPSDRR